MSVITITGSNYNQEVVNSDKPVLLDFWATWCGACKMLTPTVDAIADEVTDIKVGKVNVEEEPTIAGQFGVMSIPTLILMKNGKEEKRSVGAIPKSAVLNFIGK